MVKRDAIFIPCGSDSYNLIEETLVGNGDKWDLDAPFSKIVREPTDLEKDPILGDQIVKVDDYQTWLEKLDNAGGKINLINARFLVFLTNEY